MDLHALWTTLSLVLGFTAYAAVLLHILWSKHEEPNEAMAWTLVVLFLPVFGIAGYLLFGITRLEGVAQIMRNIRDRLDGNGEPMYGDHIMACANALRELHLDPDVALAPHNYTFDRLFYNSVPVPGNRVELLADGTEVYPRMLEDIAAAKVAIRLQSYILSSDRSGKKILDALAQKAREGVDVKVLFDSVGSFEFPLSRFFRHAVLRKTPNLQIRAFSPVNLLAPWRFQLRNHRKLLVIDGTIAYSGGINISSKNERLESVPASRYVHDLHCRIVGPAVQQFAMSFFYDWAYTLRSKPISHFVVPGEFPLPATQGDTVLRVVDSGPGSNYQATRDLFFSAAALARHSLYILTPYFVPGAEFVNALCLAAARGVRVVVIVPKHNNHFYVDLAAKSTYRKLLAGGVEIHEKRGIFSHIKALMVDNEWGFMGSSNCDSRSFRLNFELDFVFEKGDFVTDMLKTFYAELEESDEVDLAALENRPYIHRFIENFFALFTPML